MSQTKTYKILGEKNGNVFIDFRLQGQTHQNALDSITQENPEITPREQQNKLIEFCLSHYLAHEKQTIWRMPHIQNLKAEPNQLNFRAILTRFPQVVLPANPQVQIDVPELTAPEKHEVQAFLDNFLMRFQKQNLVERPADWGDMVTLNMYGHCENELIPNSAQLRFPLLLKPPITGDADPIMSGVIGLSAGDKKQISIHLPETYPYAPWRGKEARYEIQVMEIREVLIPELDNELAHQLNFKNVLVLLESLMTELKDMRKTQWQSQLRSLALQTYLTRAQVNIPDKWVDEALKQAWQATDFKNLKQMRAPKEFVLNSFETWKKQTHLKDLERHRLKTKFVLRELLRQQNIELTRADIDKAITAFSKDQPKEDIYAELQESGLLNDLSETLFFEKGVDVIMGYASLKYGDKAYTVPQ